MNTKNESTTAEKFQKARWNAWMDALETNWLTKIAATQAEYHDERMRLQEKQSEPEDDSKKHNKSA